MRQVKWGAADMAGRALALALGFVFLAALTSTPKVAASGQDVIFVESPKSWSGPVDTQVALIIEEYSGSAYTLSYTTTSPDNGGCASAQPMPGVGPIQTATQASAQVTFRWPATLGHGQYYFCADPAPGGSGGHAASHQPYTVLNDTAPAVQVSTNSPIQAGTSITFQLTNWVTSDAQLLPQVGLLAQGAPYSALLPQGQVTTNSSDPGSGSFAYTMQISPITPAGTYALVVESECDMGAGTGNIACPVTEQSGYFDITAAPTPTLGPTVTPLPLPTATRDPHATPGILSGGNPGNVNPKSDNTLLYVAGAGVGVTGVAGGVVFFLMRRRRKM